MPPERMCRRQGRQAETEKDDLTAKGFSHEPCYDKAGKARNTFQEVARGCKKETCTSTNAQTLELLHKRVPRRGKHGILSQASVPIPGHPAQQVMCCKAKLAPSPCAGARLSGIIAHLHHHATAFPFIRAGFLFLNLFLQSVSALLSPL